jgi:hypothetical protein
VDERPHPTRLAEVSDDVAAGVVDLLDRLTGGTSSNTVHLARRIGRSERGRV